MDFIGVMASTPFNLVLLSVIWVLSAVLVYMMVSHKPKQILDIAFLVREVALAIFVLRVILEFLFGFVHSGIAFISLLVFAAACAFVLYAIAVEVERMVTNRSK